MLVQARDLNETTGDLTRQVYARADQRRVESERRKEIKPRFEKLEPLARCLMHNIRFRQGNVLLEGSKRKEYEYTEGGLSALRDLLVGMAREKRPELFDEEGQLVTGKVVSLNN